MKRIIKSSAGDVTLYNFVFIKSPMLGIYGDVDYDAKLGGYLYLWSYTYNTITRYTDDRMTAHSDVIDNLDPKLRKLFKQEGQGCWGKTDWFKDHIRFYCSDFEELTAQDISRLKRLCNIH